MLDNGEVGCRAPRIQPVRRRDGGAGIDAGRALAAVRRLPARQRQRKIRVDLAPRKKVDPASRLSASVCLPRQPCPLRLAVGLRRRRRIW